jgi:hypothetical protein
MFFVKMNIFPILIKSLVLLPLEEHHYSKTARVFELCACHQEGIAVLQKYLDSVVALCDTFL